MPRKRKTPEEENEEEHVKDSLAKKKSKKQRLAEARKLAKEWAAKEAAAKSKSKSRTSEPASIEPKSLGPSLKRRKIEEDNHDKPMKKSKKQQREEARAWAKAWAEEHLENTAAKALSPRASTPTAAKKSTRRPRQPVGSQISPGQGTGTTASGREETPSTGTRDDVMEVENASSETESGNDERMEENEPTRVSPEREVSTQEPTDTPTSPAVHEHYSNAAHAFAESSTHVIAAQQSATTFSKSNGVNSTPSSDVQCLPKIIVPPPATTPREDKPSEDNGMRNEVPIIPPASYPDIRKHVEDELGVQDQQRRDLEKRIQEQVMANALASGQPRSPSFPSPNYSEEIPRGPQRRPYLWCSVFMLITLLCVLGAFVSIGSTGESSLSREVTLAPCYLTTSDASWITESERGPDQGSNSTRDHGNKEEERRCDHGSDPLPCPKGGSCWGGVLQQCTSSLRQPSTSGNQCVLTEQANRSLAEIESTVMNWTLQYHCDTAGCDFGQKGDVAPLFPLSQLPSTYVGVNTELIGGSDILVKTMKEGVVFVALSDDYFRNELDFPFSCWMMLTVMSLLTLSIGFSSLVFSITTSSLWNWTVAHPIISFVCLVVLWLVRTLRMRRARKAKLDKYTANAKQMVYDQLMEGRVEHAVLHLRDGVAHGMFPNSKADRQIIIKKVWPRVVADIRTDNRVMKANKWVEGKACDIWKWVATPNKSRRVGFQMMKTN